MRETILMELTISKCRADILCERNSDETTMSQYLIHGCNDH